MQSVGEGIQVMASTADDDGKHHPLHYDIMNSNISNNIHDGILITTGNGSSHHHHRHDDDTKQQTSCLNFQFLDNGILFDRNEQIYNLEEAVNRRLTNDSKPELILISGSSGTGKTCLAKQLRESVINDRGGFFTMGKFDQLRRNDPFAPLVAALTKFVGQVLERKNSSDNKEVLAEIKGSILEIVGDVDIGILTELIPAIKNIVGEPKEGALFALKSIDSEERLKTIFCNFIRAVCSPTRPLVLVMDDLQWADLGSLELLEAISCDTENHGLAIIGICRSDEVSIDNDFARILRRLEEEKDTLITNIVVHCLSLQATNGLVAAVLQCPENECRGVSQTIYSKTKGNVFFIVEFLRALHDYGVLARDSMVDNRGWLWDDRLWASNFEDTDNIANLIIRRIKGLPPECQLLLLYSACLGSELDDSLLSKLFVDSLTVGAEQTCELFSMSTMECMPNVDLDDAIALCAREGVIIKESHSQHYRFLHDRVQEAAYHLVDEAEHPTLHLSIGRFLTQTLSQEEVEEYIYIIVDQMYRGLELITTEQEKIFLASLCLCAGNKSIVSSDFKTALKFLDFGLSLLNLRKSWRDEYHLTLNLYNTITQASCCLGYFDRVDNAVDLIAANARSYEDRLHGLMLQIYSLGIRLRLKDSLELGLEVLKNLGETFPKTPSVPHILFGLFEVKRMLRNKSKSTILALPDMNDPKKLAAMGVLNLLIAPCFLAQPNLFPLIAFRMMKLSLKYGNSAISSMGYTSYGLVLATLHDYDGAYEYGKLGLSVIERYNSIRNDWIPRVYVIHYGMLANTKELYSPCIDKLSSAYHIGLDCGDSEFAFIALHMVHMCSFAAGHCMTILEPKIKAALVQMKKRNQILWYEMTHIAYEAMLVLMGRTEDPAVLNGCLMTLEEGSERLTQVLQTANLDIKVFLGAAAVYRMVLAFHSGDLELALRFGKKTRNGSKIFGTATMITYQTFHYGLVCLATIRQDKPSLFVRRRLLKEARICLNWLLKAFETVPENQIHRVLVLQAEWLVLQNKPQEAIAKYKESQEHAKSFGILDVRAIACEREALTQIELNEPDAPTCQERSASFYKDWGALTKADRIKSEISNFDRLWHA